MHITTIIREINFLPVDEIEERDINFTIQILDSVENTINIIIQ